MSVIGTGDIASVLPDREDITFFASGVSDSSCSDLNKFKREIDLLLQMPRQRHLVYFSSLARYYAHTPYVAHKKRMELLVKQTFDSWTIVRLGNIDWGTNPHTLINYLKAHPEAPVQNVFRHVVSKEEFLYWINFIQPGINNEMNVPGKMVWVPDLAKLFNKHCGNCKHFHPGLRRTDLSSVDKTIIGECDNELVPLRICVKEQMICNGKRHEHQTNTMINA